jgi:CBS domain containing-hemolysin-like protein
MTAVLLVAVVVLIFINGFFVAAEFALVRCRRPQLETLAEEGKAGATRALHLLDDLNQYLSACQVGITMASLAIGFLGEAAIAELLEPALGNLSHAIAAPLAIALAYILVTAGHITVGEQVPKIYSIIHAEKTVMRIARPLMVFNVILRPFITVLNSASNGLLRLIGIDPRDAMDDEATPQELRVLIAQARAGGKLDAGEAGMLSGVFHLHEQEARQVMTPIPAVVTIDVSETVEAALGLCVDTGHTRLLVTENDNKDSVRGVVHSNSLAGALMSDGPKASIEPLVRETIMVPETKPLDDLLADLQRGRSSMSVVIDEYGRVTGIVTVEDIVEEVVGEIDDETDPAGGDVRRLANGDWFVHGHVAITDLDDHDLHLPVDSDAYNSVGGFVFSELGRMAKRGDTVMANGYSIRVEAVRDNRIESVRIRERGPQQRPAASAS